MAASRRMILIRGSQMYPQSNLIEKTQERNSHGSCHFFANRAGAHLGPRARATVGSQVASTGCCNQQLIRSHQLPRDDPREGDLDYL
jgi:hypothetical protein